VPHLWGTEILVEGGEGVGEVVGVVAVFDDDLHGAVEADELAGGGVRDDDDVEMEDAVLHGAVVLQEEGAGTASEGAGDAFDGDITAGAFDDAHAGEHFAFAGGVEIAVELFVNGEAADGVVVGFEGGIEGEEFDVEGAGGVLGHGGVLLLDGDGEEESDEGQGEFHGDSSGKL
jgi:hypothetical protein